MVTVKQFCTILVALEQSILARARRQIWRPAELVVNLMPASSVWPAFRNSIVKRLLKLAYKCHSYRENKTGTFLIFHPPRCIVNCMVACNSDVSTNIDHREREKRQWSTCNVVCVCVCQVGVEIAVSYCGR